MSTSSQNPERDEYIAALRKLADWLESNPAVKVPTDRIMLLPLHTNKAVQEFAETCGLTVSLDSDGNASADVDFGGIVYHAYGYDDFDAFHAGHKEKQARRWADENGMVIERHTDGGAA